MNPDEIGPVTALASLPGVGPSRLGVLLEAGPPAEVWQRIVAGTLRAEGAVTAALGARAESLLTEWRAAAGGVDPEMLAEAQQSLGIRLLDAGDPEYPEAFRRDVEPPRVLWVTGDWTRIATHTVAIVGTRRCTRYGHDVARRFGAELAAAGVSVVSGLALGIDAAAHAGVLDAGERAAPPVGVVGTGLDVVYPRRNRNLWRAVAERGVLCSEAPPGAKAEPWRFPARNRLIAALAQIVIVVESTEKGGSLYTVDEALRRDVEVRAVPGPVTAPSSTGTNRLLADGAAPALCAAELLETLGVAAPAPRSPGRQPYRAPEERTVLDVLTSGPVTLDELAERSGLGLEQLALVTARLQVEGRLVRSSGYYERTG